MADDDARAKLALALERLRTEMLAYMRAVGLPSSSPVRDHIIRALDNLQLRLQHDEAWVEEMIRELPAAMEPPAIGPR